MQITLDEVKQQCRVEHDFEDDLLATLLNAAKGTIESITNRQLFERLPPNPPDNALELNHEIKIAVLMLAAYYYENRSGWNEANAAPNFDIPPTVERLVSPHRWITL